MIRACPKRGRVASTAAHLIEERPAARDASLHCAFRGKFRGDLRGRSGHLTDQRGSGNAQRLLACEMTLRWNCKERGGLVEQVEIGVAELRSLGVSRTTINGPRSQATQVVREYRRCYPNVCVQRGRRLLQHGGGGGSPAKAAKAHGTGILEI